MRELILPTCGTWRVSKDSSLVIKTNRCPFDRKREIFLDPVEFARHDGSGRYFAIL